MKLKHPFFCFQTTLYDSLMCLSRAKTMSRARGGGHTTPENGKQKDGCLSFMAGIGTSKISIQHTSIYYLMHIYI